MLPYLFPTFLFLAKTFFYTNVCYQSCTTAVRVTRTSLTYNEVATKCQSSSPEVVPANAWYSGSTGDREVTWVYDSLEWTLKQRACKHGSAHRCHSGEEPPAGYNMQLKVERSLRNIIMMFVTANDSARVENKRGTSGFVSNGAEEWLREVVVVVGLREAGVD